MPAVVGDSSGQFAVPDDLANPTQAGSFVTCGTPLTRSEMVTNP